MRTVPIQPASQLRSACLRYVGNPLAGTGLPAFGANGWAGHGSVRPKATASASGVPAADEPLRARLEAVLFLAKEPLSSRKLAQFAGLEDGTRARTLVHRLNAEYDGSGRAFRVEEAAGGYQLLTRRKFSGWLRRLAHMPGEARLSPPALETLAVIAYRQPVLRADIEAIRGVNCGEILRQLMERDLVRIAGRSEELGRPFLYATTRRFLNLFGLHSLEDLPRGAILRNSPLVPGPPLNIHLTDEEGASPSGQESAPEYTVDDDGNAETEPGEFRD